MNFKWLILGDCAWLDSLSCGSGSLAGLLPFLLLLCEVYYHSGMSSPNNTQEASGFVRLAEHYPDMM